MAAPGPVSSSPYSYELSPLFTWRTAIASPHGPASATRRHVLLTLSLHMNERGGSCFPTTARLAAETKLSERAVEEHLRVAEEEGWIERRDLEVRGRGWRRVAYKATVPVVARSQIQKEWESEQESETGREGSKPGRHGPEPRSGRSREVRNLTTRGPEPRSGKDVKEDVTSTSVELPLDLPAAMKKPGEDPGPENSGKSERSKPRRRMREDWRPSAGDRAWALATHDLAETELAAATDEFVAFWIGEGTARADWGRTWRKRIDALVEDGRLRPGGSGGDDVVVGEDGVRILRHG